VNSSKEEQIQKQSIDMIKKVECTEEAFRANFNREIQRKKNDLVSIDCDSNLDEQRNLEKIQNQKLKIESSLEFVQKQHNRFKLFEYDLVRNKFQHASKNDESNEANLFFFGVNETSIVSISFSPRHD
jgi:anthranilate/para-aminobenzoate synthase component I